MCCCCCCPPAISALFCLWVQSGFSQGTVAGALTFFPPEPALYQFERHSSKTGRVLNADEEDDDDDETDTPESAAANAKSAEEEAFSSDDDENDETNATAAAAVGTMKANADATNNTPLTIAETRAKTKKKLKSPVEELTDQALERRKRSLIRNARDARDATAGVTYRLLLDPRLQVPPHDDRAIAAVKIPSPRGVHLAAVVYRIPADRCTATTKTILISHGNATDNGAMFPIQVILAHSLDCHVITYDYSGYGESGGVPTECATYRDMDAVFDYTVEQVATNQCGSNVILYGQSVGSGPCCYLAAKPDETVGGLILHSPFTSGMRVLTPSRALACLDIYPNIDRIKKVQCPVMVIHGCLDQEVDISHGQELHRAVPTDYQRDPWWVADRGHNDITDGPGKLAEYIRRIRRFIQSL